MRHAAYALVGLIMGVAALAFSSSASQAAAAGTPTTNHIAANMDGMAKKVYHSRHRSHWRWGSRHYHSRHRSHWRWGSRHYHGRHRSHWRWGSRHYHSRHRSHWRWGSRW
jgi:hypothetical protein